MCSCREQRSPRSCCQHKVRKQLYCSYFYKLPLCAAKVNHKLITASCRPFSRRSPARYSHSGPRNEGNLSYATLISLLIFIFNWPSTLGVFPPSGQPTHSCSTEPFDRWPVHSETWRRTLGDAVGITGKSSMKRLCKSENINAKKEKKNASEHCWN